MPGPDPRLPVVVGAGQVVQRTADPAEAREPVDLMADAVLAAVADAGAPRLATAVESVAVARVLSWRYRDPGRMVADRIGADPRHTAVSTVGGQSPQVLLDRAAAAVQAGHLDVAVVCGAEAWRTRSRYRRAGERPPWTLLDEAVPPAEEVGDDAPMSAPEELELGLALPVQLYPVFESALRAAAGRSVADHQRHLGRLWAGFAEVAAANPSAWLRERFTPEEIATPSPANRMVGFPYPKLMCANNDVDMAAALVVCSAGRAAALGVPRDRWVFPHSAAEADDTAFVGHRPDLRSSPAVRAAGAAALGLAGAGPDDLAHVDLYSCFPSAVQVAAAELGLGLDRPLTVTGGLSFAGGPWNDYVTHAVAAMVGRLRDDGSGLGLVTANGGFLTKHAVGVYGAGPPAGGFRVATPQAEADAAGRRELVTRVDGRATVEGLTVVHDRDGTASTAFVAAITPGGERTWATTSDPAAMATMEAEEVVGRTVAIAGGTVVDLEGG